MVWLVEEECRFETIEGTEMAVLPLLKEPDESAPEHEETLARIHSCFDPKHRPPLPDPDSRSPGCRRTEGPLPPSLLTLCLTLLLFPSSSASGSSAASGVGTPCRRFSASGSHGTSGCRGVATRVLDVF